jgi:hypothetical protein
MHRVPLPPAGGTGTDEGEGMKVFSWDDYWTSDEEFYLMCKAYVTEYEAEKNSLICTRSFDDQAD